MANEPTAVFPDEQGRYGDFGGKFIPETLMAAVAELEEAYNRVKGMRAFNPACLAC